MWRGIEIMMKGRDPRDAWTMVSRFCGVCATVHAKLKSFVESGQLGIFANGYQGHKEYRLPPEANLMAVAHYLEALDWQRDIIRAHALLGAKNPHPQTFLVGGMSIPVDPNNQNALNAGSIALLNELAQKS